MNQLLLYNGSIYSIDEDNSVYSWMVIKDGIITEMGKSMGDMPDISESINLHGKCVLPSFFDNHFNLVLAGINSFAINLSHTECLEDVFAIIRDRCKTTFPGEMIRCVGFIEAKVKEKRFPTRQELDLCAPNNPVILSSIAYHSSSVNSLMLHKLGLPYNLTGMNKDACNSYTGYLTYRANIYARNLLFSKIDDTVRSVAVNKIIDMAISNGITNMVTFEGGYISHENHAQYIIENRSTFPIDVKLFYQSTNLNKAKENQLSMVGGLFLDGVISNKTAAFFDNYSGTDHGGELYFKQSDINQIVLNSHVEGFQVTAHCIGDKAISQLLTAYEYAQSVHYRTNHRHRIEHCELMDDEMIARAKELGLVLSMQPSYEYYWGGEYGLYHNYLGERGRKTNNFRKLIDKGLIIAGGSAYDVTEINPWLGIHMAVNHPTSTSRITIEEAIKMYTINGAYAVFEEKKKGSLEIGKDGDCIILDKNPFKISADQLKTIEVMETIKEGHILYRQEV